MNQEDKSILTGILWTVAIHLVALIALFVVRLGEAKTVHKEILTVEIEDQVYKSIKELQKEKKIIESKVGDITDREKRNIAVNTAHKMEEKISTEKYVDDIKKELGIEEQEPIKGNDPVYTPPQKKDRKKPQSDKIYQGPTRVSYYLKNRKARYIHKPIYVCEGAGKVVVGIVVDQSGKVVSTDLKSSTTSEDCIINMAIDAARSSYFNIDHNAAPKQEGTITYDFVSQ